MNVAWQVLLKESHSDNNCKTVKLCYGTRVAPLVQTSINYDYYHVDTIFYDDDCDYRYVRKCLIDHDGYPENIVLRKVKWPHFVGL